MSFRHRRRVDWNEEIRKTEEIRRRGMFMSLLSFAVAAAVIVALNRVSGMDISLPRRVISVACIVLACLVMRVTLKHRARVLQERRESREKARLAAQAAKREAGE